MNLSKTEKLLAAKKRLKEFQMSKMMHDGASKQSLNQNPVDPLPNQCQIESKKVEMQIEHEPQIQNIPQTSSQENSVKIKPNPEIEEQAEPQNNQMEDELVVKKESQKEHILQMASAVADVLTSDGESTFNENILECDPVCKNEFVDSYLEEQKKIVNDLHLEISNYRSRVMELESQNTFLQSDIRTQVEREVAPLRAQLQAGAQATGVLLAEKAELSAALTHAQQAMQKRNEENEELSTKLKNSQIRISELEKEVSVLRNNSEETRKNSQQLRNDYDILEHKFSELKKEKEDINLEASELRQKLNLKKMELLAVQQELQEKSALLSLSELRVQQMKDNTQSDEDKHSTHLLQQVLSETQESLKVLMIEKEEAGKQYQNYIRQLDTQQGKLVEELKQQQKTIENFEAREQSYIQRLSELDQQLQQEKQKGEEYELMKVEKEKMEQLLRNIDEMTLEQERLHISLSEKDSLIESLTKELQDQQESKSENQEASKLASALESEKVGAARAVQQNRVLKEQLTDMENAFVSLSNAKLDLTEQLQAERSIGRKLNARLNSVENELEDVKERLKEKDIMCQELEKEKLQNAQIADQMHHYQAQSMNVNTFQRELQNALLQIQKLEKINQGLQQKLNQHLLQVQCENTDFIMNGDHIPENETEGLDVTEPENDRSQLNENLSGQYESIENISDQSELTEKENGQLLLTENDSGISSTIRNENVTVSEPIRKLEQRFKETMERVAELTEEKQKLEHLVMQLQSETETIGEYIALYQKQRAVLQNRAKEKEQVFRQLLEQRNLQQEQLHKLKVLVSEFLHKEYIHSNEMDDNDGRGSESHLTQNQEINSRIEHKSVSELLDLLTEIKDCKDSCIFEPNFHPCPWCSGKLITV